MSLRLPPWRWTYNGSTSGLARSTVQSADVWEFTNFAQGGIAIPLLSGEMPGWTLASVTVVWAPSNASANNFVFQIQSSGWSHATGVTLDSAQSSTIAVTPGGAGGADKFVETNIGTVTAFNGRLFTGFTLQRMVNHVNDVFTGSIYLLDVFLEEDS